MIPHMPSTNGKMDFFPPELNTQRMDRVVPFAMNTIDNKRERKAMSNPTPSLEPCKVWLNLMEFMQAANAAQGRMTSDHQVLFVWFGSIFLPSGSNDSVVGANGFVETESSDPTA